MQDRSVPDQVPMDAVGRTIAVNRGAPVQLFTPQEALVPLRGRRGGIGILEDAGVPVRGPHDDVVLLRALELVEPEGWTLEVDAVGALGVTGRPVRSVSAGAAVPQAVAPVVEDNVGDPGRLPFPGLVEVEGNLSRHWRMEFEARVRHCVDQPVVDEQLKPGAYVSGTSDGSSSCPDASGVNSNRQAIPAHPARPF